jgi:hypothetical protein
MNTAELPALCEGLVQFIPTVGTTNRTTERGKSLSNSKKTWHPYTRHDAKYT